MIRWFKGDDLLLLLSRLLAKPLSRVLLLFNFLSELLLFEVYFFEFVDDLELGLFKSLADGIEEETTDIEFLLPSHVADLHLDQKDFVVTQADGH